MSGARTVKITKIKNLSVLAEQCEVADHYVSRLKGLLGRSGLREGGGLWIRPCNSIHMWFMKFSIDVVFVRPNGGELEVSSIYPAVRPWRLLPLSDFAATEVLELPAGAAARCALAKGDRLCTS